MSDINLIHKRVIALYENPQTWIDPYDTEDYSNKFVRRVLKLIMLFAPKILYKSRIVKSHIWSENYELIGQCFMNLGDIKRAEQVYFDLLKLTNGDLYWGLPIEWKSGKYSFPPNTMMSTTTSEIALFFVELSRVSSVVDNSVLKNIAYNLINSLYKVYEDENKIILGYTPFDEYRVNNANLLVAAALYEIGQVINDSKLINISVKITNACLDGIDLDGGIPYTMNGHIYDSYHQVFSLRALRILSSISKEVHSAYEKSIDYLKNDLMSRNGIVYLTPRKKRIDMQGAAEALRFFSMINDKEMIIKIKKQIQANLTLKNNVLIQRRWKLNKYFSIKSNVLFTRQGELRILLAQILAMDVY